MFSEIRILQHQILAFCENHGYPFASIFLDSIRLKENQISARLHLDSAHLVIFDSAIVYGDFKLKTKFRVCVRLFVKESHYLPYSLSAKPD